MEDLVYDVSFMMQLLKNVEINSLGTMKFLSLVSMVGVSFTESHPLTGSLRSVATQISSSSDSTLHSASHASARSSFQTLEMLQLTFIACRSIKKRFSEFATFSSLSLRCDIVRSVIGLERGVL